MIKINEAIWTDRVRKVMGLAHVVADEWGHTFVGTEHLLAALCREGNGVAANVLRNLDAIDKVEPEIKRLLGNCINVNRGEVS